MKFEAHCRQKRPGRSPQIVRRPMRHRQPRAFELGARRAVGLVVVDRDLDGHTPMMQQRIRQ